MQVLFRCKRLLVSSLSSSFRRCLLAPADTAVIAQRRDLHTTSYLLKNKKKSRDIKRKHLAQKATRAAEEVASRPSPIVGIPTEFTRSLLRPAQAYQAAVDPNLPQIKTFNLDEKDEKFLTEVVPQAAIDLPTTVNPYVTEAEKAETVQKIVSLHNANAHAVLIHNVKRAVEQFARFEGDTGTPEVQAAVWTVRILNLYEHAKNNHKDHDNFRSLRKMVHNRQSILRYLKKKDLERYYTCLKRLGLDSRVVEKEIVI
ncbi:hypothetical protein G9A89_014839 [Geosiphon pyriformis]|nr:hypothetical protein G9A89_014839 [Geosiphon pyriformis]